MEIIEIPINQLSEASWNANRADDVTMARLRTSIIRYSMVQNLVVRPIGNRFEVLSGNQRFRLLGELGISTVPCVVVDVDDGHAWESLLPSIPLFIFKLTDDIPNIIGVIECFPELDRLRFFHLSIPLLKLFSNTINLTSYWQNSGTDLAEFCTHD